eukprot:2284955-Amphidinium_carterae.1
MLTNLGNAYGSLGDAFKKRDFLERALRIKESHYGPEHPDVAITLTNLGNCLWVPWQCFQDARLLGKSV